MSRYLPIAALAALLFFPSPAVHADGRALAAQIEPFLTDTAIGALCLSLEQVRFKDVGDVLEKYLSGPAVKKQVDTLAAALSAADALRTQLKDSGVSDIAFVLELQHVMHGPYILIPYAADGKPEQIISTVSAGLTLANIPADRQPKFTDLGGAIFGGDESVLKLIQNKVSADRPHLAEAFAATDGYGIQVVVCPSTDQSRAIAEAVPPLPVPLDRIDGNVLSRGVQYLSIGVNLSPMPAMKLLIQSADAESAGLLLDAQHRALNLAANQPSVTAMFPDAAKYLERLKLSREETQLALTLKADEASMQDLAKLLALPLREAQKVSGRSRSLNNLKQLGLGWHNWHDVYKVFPAHANYSPDGKPLLSWRVHILPYIDQAPLYAQFRLNEPWDSEHNKKLIAQMPAIYAVPGSKVAAEGKTAYVTPIPTDGSGLTTGTKDGNQFKDLTDGTSNTVMVVVADDKHSVPWTKPEDLPVDPKKPLDGLRIQDGVFQFLMADGSAHSFPANIDPANWWKFLTRAGGETVEYPK